MVYCSLPPIHYRPLPPKQRRPMKEEVWGYFVCEVGMQCASHNVKISGGACMTPYVERMVLLID